MTVVILAAYAVMVSAVLALTAWLLERAFTSLRLPVRGVWIGALGLSIGLPLVSLLSVPDRPGSGSATFPEAVVLEATAGAAEATIGGAGPGAGEPLGPLLDWRAALSDALSSGAALLPADERVEAWISGIWGAGSILVGSILLAAMLRLRRKVRQCPGETVLGWSARVSPHLGPATVGVLSPLIVIPRWAKTLPPDELALVLHHEAEHVRSRDPLLLAVGLLAVVACPWNPIMWWQVRRLKEAVEVDCDRRVLQRGISPAPYGKLLLNLGSRGRISSLMVPTIAGSRSLLERRLTMMKNLQARISVPGVLAASSAALILLVVACSTEPPMGADGQPQSAATASEAAPETENRDVLAATIRIDRSGTVRVNDVITPVNRVSEAVAPSVVRNGVYSIEAHQAAPYRVVAEVQNQLGLVDAVRVVFTTVASDAQRSPERDVRTLLATGLAVVLPRSSLPVIDVANLNPRNLLFLDVLPSGVVAARLRDEQRVQEIGARDVEALWRQEVAQNANLIALVSTHPDADYRHMYNVLDALRRAEATRFSLQVMDGDTRGIPVVTP